MSDRWDSDALTELRAAVARADGAAILTALDGRVHGPMLQLSGDGLLIALAVGLRDAHDLAVTCVAMLRARVADGDHELADALEAALAGRVPADLSPLPVDLDELSCSLEGDPLDGGGRIDLRNGEVWPEPVYGDSWSDDDEDDDPEAEHWLYFDSQGSHDGYRDMELFVEEIEAAATARRLAAALRGRGAFRHFRDTLDRCGPELVDQWRAFSEDRRRGRARAWLVTAGYRPTPLAITRRDRCERSSPT